jgi:hypothetical protein
VYSNPVFKGDNPQNFARKLFNTAPESIAIPFLGLCSDWILQNLNAPFLFKIGPIAQNFILKIWGVLLRCHTRLYSPSMTGNHAPPNVRLQARAAGGAPLCKVLFGGNVITILSTFSTLFCT